MSFSRYQPEDSVISSETVVRPMWTGDVYTLNTFFTASSYTEYYLDVYQTGSALSGSEVQFSIQYGNVNGSGSAPINNTVVGNSPSRVVYGQYRNLVYGTEAENFSFDSGTSTANDIYVINISRARYKQAIQPGTLNLTLTSGSAIIRLTDDSNTTSLTRFVGENRIYYVISGSNGNAYTSSAATTYYGMVLPDLGVIILNATSSYIQPTNQATSSVNNHLKLFNSISSGSGVNFQLSSQETISSRYFFTRIKNGEFNYTTNPSIIDANGNLLYNSLINNPQTYITTVGLYNDNNELLAVAKSSRPLVKDFTKEALVRVKIDY